MKFYALYGNQSSNVLYTQTRNCTLSRSRILFYHILFILRPIYYHGLIYNLITVGGDCELLSSLCTLLAHSLTIIFGAKIPHSTPFQKEKKQPLIIPI
jgi:hypothetical protein